MHKKALCEASDRLNAAFDETEKTIPAYRIAHEDFHSNIASMQKDLEAILANREVNRVPH